jgi:hypothetical protein
VATTIASIISQARQYLHEPAEVTNGQWTDAELLLIVGNCVKDLYRGVKDTYQNFFFTLDESNVSLPANSFVLTGVPADAFIVLGIEPRDLGSYGHIEFVRREFTHRDFRAARGLSARTLQQTGDTCEIFYTEVGAGAPVSAPTIYAAPKLAAALLLRLIYVPTLTLGANNPIPGESDQAIINWTVAYAKSKIREDQEPDPDWLELYKTEKIGVIVACSPRDESDVERVEDFFEFD